MEFTDNNDPIQVRIRELIVKNSLSKYKTFKFVISPQSIRFITFYRNESTNVSLCVYNMIDKDKSSFAIDEHVKLSDCENNPHFTQI